MIKNDLNDAKLLELSEILKKILEYKSELKWEEGLLYIKKAYKELLGLNGELVEKLSVDDVIGLISAHEAAEIYKLVILAKLLEAESDLYDCQNNTSKALNIKLKSLYVFNRALSLDKGTTLGTSKESMESIVDYLSSYEMGQKAYEIIMKHFELLENFDKAEDAYYELLEENKDNEGVIKLGIDFYSRLLDKEDWELEKGNLSLSEVREALDYLKGLRKR
ncbi:MAG: hypothetical protein GX895_04590 [Clostridiales bacterium]|mgnify:CR=1 FL=1|uniref:DUF6483 family protein n=1 Tax=Clostridium sp. N3C TaxID=1776758 RepID=UPI00092E0449|nr:DUF6483 family protein [Clostridium sp. N3C]NLZ48058.1 hypothetical protein [Clostridiales bacterium]SCN22203.1 hypothetical protein N3C_0641 [Clostridium sp. N3C]